ncbi:MAG: MBL fold metallo-hydrolase [Flavobacteriales bacterium]
MSKIKVTFLGTGTSMGVPVIGCKCETCLSADPKDKRLRTSILIQHGQKNIVIDSGPDFRQQMLTHDVESLAALIFTHEHKDHTAGTDDVRAFNFIQQKPITIWASDRVEAALRKEFHYAFAEIKYPGVPEIRFKRITDEPFEIDGLKFIPLPVLHHKLPVYGFRIGAFVYITDANQIPYGTLDKIQDAEVLVLNALRKTSHISHFTLDEAVEIAQRVEAKQTYLLHISHQMGKHAAVDMELPAGISLAYDGLEIEVD